MGGLVDELDQLAGVVGVGKGVWLELVEVFLEDLARPLHDLVDGLAVPVGPRPWPALRLGWEDDVSWISPRWDPGGPMCHGFVSLVLGWFGMHVDQPCSLHPLYRHHCSHHLLEFDLLHLGHRTAGTMTSVLIAGVSPLTVAVTSISVVKGAAGP